MTISRVIDNKHHPSDVAAGAFLGTVIGVIFILRALPRHYAVLPEPRQRSSEPLLDGSAEEYSPRISNNA